MKVKKAAFRLEQETPQCSDSGKSAAEVRVPHDTARLPDTGGMVKEVSAHEINGEGRSDSQRGALETQETAKAAETARSQRPGARALESSAKERRRCGGGRGSAGQVGFSGKIHGY